MSSFYPRILPRLSPACHDLLSACMCPLAAHAGKIMLVLTAPVHYRLPVHAVASRTWSKKFIARLYVIQLCC